MKSDIQYVYYVILLNIKNSLIGVPMKDKLHLINYINYRYSTK